ncbi:MAG: efflux RND transporter periplasmic adaptor subunit [Candidatus Rhabdochlamydia sp.]
MKKWMLFLLLCSCSKEIHKAPVLPYVKIASAMQQDVPLFLEYVGHIEPNLQVSIRSQVSGILEEVHFIEGKSVNKGDLLLTLHKAPFEAAVQQCEAVLNHNLALYQQAQDTLKRYHDLQLNNYISQLDYENLKTNLSITEAAVEESRALLRKAQLDLDNCCIYAPFAGVMGKLYQDPGSYISVGGESPLVTLNQITPIRLTFHVPEKDFGLITSFQAKGSLKTEIFYQNKWIEGTLFLIDNAINELTGTCLLQALFPNQDQALWPGMFADVRLILTTQRGAITLPSKAVSPGQKGPYIYVLQDDQTVELREVMLGQDDLQSVVITKGVSAGERVVTEGQIHLTPGVKVQVKR